MIVVFCAVEQELKGLKKGMARQIIPNNPDFHIYLGRYKNRERLLVLTGMGKERARKATNFVLSKYPVSMIISAGCGGSLNKKTGVGDIVVGSEIFCEKNPGTKSIPMISLHSNSKLVSQAIKALQEFDLHFLLGKGITVSRVCETSASKFHLGQEYDADMVDMESYWIGHIANENKVPFIMVQSVVDAAGDDLSILSSLMTDGKITSLKVLRSIIVSPGRINKLCYLALSSRKAERNLSFFIRKWTEGL